MYLQIVGGLDSPKLLPKNQENAAGLLHNNMAVQVQCRGQKEGKIIFEFQ